MDGLGNDNDGKIDFPEDPGCHSANDDAEVDVDLPESEINPRLLVVFDTSGSMNWHACDSDLLLGR